MHFHSNCMQQPLLVLSFVALIRKKTIKPHLNLAHLPIDEFVVGAIIV